jgi:hypothetical protein
MADVSSIWSRRNILVGLAAGGAAGGAASVALFSDSNAFKLLLRPDEQGRRGAKLGTGTVGDWQLQVGSLFTADSGHVLKLVDVQSFGETQGHPSNVRAKAFVARFDITKGGAMEGDRTYRFAHREGGTFDMFLAPENSARPERMIAIFG